MNRSISYSGRKISEGYLQGSSLLYTLLIALITSTLLSCYLLVNYYQQVRMDRLYWEEIARDNLQSGVEIWLSESPPKWGESIAFPLFESPIDSFIGQSEAWGLFGILHGTGTHSRSRVSRSCLIGEMIPSHRQESLYLVDRRQPLVLVGKTRLAGTLALPPSGIKSGFIGRRGFENRQLYQGRITHSKRDMPELNIENKDHIAHYLHEISIVPPAEQAFALEGENVSRLWHEQVYEIISPGSVQIRQSSIQGKCRIISAHTITVGADAQLDQVTLFARHILFEAGFQGRVQAFALESIEVEQGTKLSYPSTLMVSKQDLPGKLILHPSSTVEGAVIFDLKTFDAKTDRNDYVQLGQTSLVKGLIVADHGLEIQGEVRGQVLTGSFVLRTAGGIYRNHLIDASIDLSQLSHTYSAPLVYGSRLYQIIEWM
ncbi:MAG: hypothetical protein AAF587_31765 [Bacteroidota bacterium]